MSALINDPSRSQKWYDVTFNGYHDWDDVFAGYQATLDWPAVTYWRELATYYSQAKLLLTVRDSESWYKSMVKTVLPVMERPVADAGPARLRRLTSRRLIRDDTFNGVGLTDPAATMRRFEQHNAEVEAAFGADRLLVWRVQDGWEPLCDFLELPVPDVPFPAFKFCCPSSQICWGKIWANRLINLRASLHPSRSVQLRVLQL